MNPATRSRAIDVVIRTGIVVLALSTAYIHFNLGGLLFLANAAGYAALALAMVAPLQIAERVRWLTRFALLGYTMTTIVAWLVMGPYFQLAYIAKAIEVGLVTLLVIDILRTHGGPAGVVRQLMTLIPSRMRRPATSV